MIQNAASGTQTAALAFGGWAILDFHQTVTKNYNGSFWTSTGSLNTGRCFSRSSRYTNISISIWWFRWWNTKTGATEKFNGTSWTK
jgi:hypothetical protein